MTTDPKKLREALELLKTAMAICVEQNQTLVYQYIRDATAALTGDGELCSGCKEITVHHTCGKSPDARQPPQPDAAEAIFIDDVEQIMREKNDAAVALTSRDFISVDDQGTMKLDIFGWLQTPQGQKTLKHHTSIKIATLRPPRTEGVEPCPFCNSQADFKEGVYTSYIMCLNKDCEAMSMSSKDHRAVLNAWNRRASLPIAAPGEVEALKQIASDWLNEESRIGEMSLFYRFIDHIAKRGLIAGVKDGYAMVPVEPTEKQIDAYVNSMGGKIKEGTLKGHIHKAKIRYRAMVAAAKDEQAQQGERG